MSSRQSKNTKFSKNAMNSIQQSKNTSQKKKVKSNPNQQSRPTTSSKDSFYNALQDPFHPSSLGCQVPDPFPFPTMTFHVHQTTVLGVPSGATSASVAFMPNPVLSMIDLQHSNGLSASNIAVYNTPMTTYNSTVTSAGSAIYGAITPTALNSVYSDYRLVSWGIKISNLQPELSATGRLMVAMIPLGDTIPSYPELANATSINYLTPVFGISNSYLDSSDILELPTGFEVTVGDLLHGDLEISGMYTNTSFWEFKSTITTGQEIAAAQSGDSFSTSAANAIAQVGYKDLTRCKGGCSIVVYYEGIPTSTTNAFQVETIYHLEGTPNFSYSGNNALVSSSKPTSKVGSTAIVETTMAKASMLSNVITWVNRGANFLNDNKDTIRSIGTAIAAFL
jgi:hypothetical protein